MKSGRINIPFLVGRKQREIRPGTFNDSDLRKMEDTAGIDGEGADHPVQ
jgi:hypothetical protein